MTVTTHPCPTLLPDEMALALKALVDAYGYDDSNLKDREREHHTLKNARLIISKFNASRGKA